MDLCKIEIDFGRQSYRIYRKSISQEPPKRPAKLNMMHPFRMDVSKESFESKEMVTDGLLTSIHIPSVPDNNFEKVFNSMLPEDIAVQRSRNCTCHTRRHKDVDMNKIMFDLVNSICKTKQVAQDEYETEVKSDAISSKENGTKNGTTLTLRRNFTRGFDFWIGAEYKYDATTDNIMLKFVLIGQFPENGKQMAIDINVSGRKSGKPMHLKLKRLGQENKIGEEMTIEMVSYLETLKERVEVSLNLKRGFLRKAKSIDKWDFPLDDCHCLYPRSFWRNVVC